MRIRLVLTCALLAACSRKPDALRAPPDGGYTYLVPRPDRVYRVLRSGPLLAGDGKRIGTILSYAGDTRDVAEIRRDAEEIAAALGLEVRASGESAIVVQTNVGYGARKASARPVPYDVGFELRDGRWERAAARESDPRVLDAVEGPPRPPDDPSFPFDPAALEGAARAAERWRASLEAGDVSASAGATTKVFQLQTDVERWRALVAERSRAAGGERRELYRMQMPSARREAPADVAVVLVYDVQAPQGGRYLERIMLVNEKDGWRPGGYAFQPVR